MVSMSPAIFDLAHAAQLLAQDLDFARELKRVRSMLVVAAAAAREQRAGRRDALGRWGQHFRQAGVNAIVDLQAHGFAGQHERSQHHSAVEPSESLAAIHPFFDDDLVRRR